MKGNVLRLLRLIQRGWPVPVPSQPANRSLLFIGNFVQAVAATLKREVDGCHLLSDASVLSTEQIVRIMANALGVRARVFRVPVALLTAIGGAGDVVDRLLTFPVTSRTVSLFIQPFVVDSTPFWQAAGERAAFAPEQGFQLTAKWYGTSGASASDWMTGAA